MLNHDYHFLEAVHWKLIFNPTFSFLLEASHVFNLTSQAPFIIIRLSLLVARLQNLRNSSSTRLKKNLALVICYFLKFLHLSLIFLDIMLIAHVAYCFSSVEQSSSKMLLARSIISCLDFCVRDMLSLCHVLVGFPYIGH
ncbi:hypothetical protein VNO77_39457 [Canavalia gladiata]|uniref:Uncharacterized protein n=1 Tax=Canavalia gladiata TaxID=3824 RepID=A0AAN9KCL9_CANGL